MANTQSNLQDKAADTAKAAADKPSAHGARVADAAQNGADKVTALQQETAENTRRFVQSGIDAASQHAREISEQVSRTFGFNFGGGEESQRLAEQSKKNIDAIARCGTVLTQAFQDVSRGWYELGQKQWHRNVDGFTRLTRSRSLQEFTTIQSEIARETVQGIVHDGRGIAERSLRAAEEAGKTITSATR